MNERRNRLMDQRGFTLVEVIAVLVIIGILAAVAVPKYLAVTESASEKAADAALGNAVGFASQAFSKYLLENNKAPTLAQLQSEMGGASITMGDFTVATAVVDGAPTKVKITITTTKFTIPTNHDSTTVDLGLSSG